MRIALTFIASSVFLCLTGCGSEKTVPQNETELIAGIVADLADKSSSQQSAKDIFVTLPSEAELKKFQNYSFEAQGPAKISGSTATVKVKLMKAEDNSDAGVKDWTFVKDAEGWKIKDAPLP